MHCVRNVTEDLIWIGGNDRQSPRFESDHPVPRGMSYNSYLLLDEKTVLFDTVDRAVQHQFFENLEHALQGRRLDYVFVHHMEPDHAATLGDLLRSQLRGEDPGDSPDDGEMDSQRSYIEVTEKSDQLRQETKDSLNVYIQRSPIIGCGLGASAANRDKGVDEYFYLDMLARTGVVGLLLYMLPFGYVVAWCLRRRELLRECPEGAAVVCGLCTFWIVTWFNPWMNAVLGIAWYAVTLSVPTALEEHSI